MRNRMINAVLNGDTRGHHWCRVSWKNHLHSYIIKPKVLKIKYEDVLSHSVNESKKILDFIGEKRSVAEIEKAVDLQSFDFVKKKFIKEGEIHKAKFLRKGSSRQWKNGLNKREKLLFIKSIAPEIDSLGYERW
ncbi:sulfotransferase domain-containing protein [Salegentibacter sediminis]|uniref:sulfotransferase domain-containing protein n=1 Tax=Salegentibacter sediminis TaxID=1930251 RepID=UPI0009C0C968|nr:sulfotransferase domain-containing protein [Salegentibacter sediminis]